MAEVVRSAWVDVLVVLPFAATLVAAGVQGRSRGRWFAALAALQLPPLAQVLWLRPHVVLGSRLFGDAFVLDGLRGSTVTLLAALTVLAQLAPVTPDPLGLCRWLPGRDAVLACLLGGLLVAASLARPFVLFVALWQLTWLPAAALLWHHAGPRRTILTQQYALWHGLSGLVLAMGSFGYTALGPDASSGFGPFGDLKASLADADLGAGELSVFLAFAAAFVARIPWAPAHGWVHDTARHAPLPLLGLLLFAPGTVNLWALVHYGLLAFPRAATLALPILLTLACCSCVYAAWLACARPEVRWVLPYVSLSHLAGASIGAMTFMPLALVGAAASLLLGGLAVGALGLWASRRRPLAAASGAAATTAAAPWPRGLAACSLLVALGCLPPLGPAVTQAWLVRGTFAAHGLGISLAEAVLAQFAVVTLALFGAAVAASSSWRLFLLTGPVWRSTLGRALRVAGAGASCGAMAWLFCLPTPRSDGGVILRLVVHRMFSGAPFTATYNLATAALLAGQVLCGVALARAGRRLWRRPSNLGPGERRWLATLLATLLAVGLAPGPLREGLWPAAVALADEFRRRADWPAAAPLP